MSKFVRHMKPGLHPTNFGVIYRGSPSPEDVANGKASATPVSTDGWLPIDPSFREEFVDGMRVLRNMPVPLRDGVEILVDLFMPQTGEDFPVILSWGVYGKEDVPARYAPGADVDPEWYSRHCVFEAADPVYWTGHGYVVCYVNPRGTWYSGGINRGHVNKAEGDDVHDVIEWLGTRDWSNGKVGMSGVSYYAIIQWFAAATHPPHLAAINPWEGFSDRYRDTVFHGGILEDGLNTLWWNNETRFSLGETEDGWKMLEEHKLFDEYWEENKADLEKITVPAYVVASWTDQGLHTRGTIEGFKQIASEHKWLEVHGQKKWEYQYRPENVDRSREFFDHFLKGKQTNVMNWPKVRIEVREAGPIGKWRDEEEWPIARTDYKRLYLTPSGNFSSEFSAEGVLSYEPNVNRSRQVWLHKFDQDTEITGNSKLRLWVSVDGGDDTDIFVSLDKLDVNGAQVDFRRFSVFEDGPVALGWHRASHRDQDPEKTKEHQPWYTHEREVLLNPGEVIPVDIEILPSSTLFKAGETLKLTVQGSDIVELELGTIGMGHSDTKRCAKANIHLGEEHASYLLLPFMPEKGN